MANPNKVIELVYPFFISKLGHCIEGTDFSMLQIALRIGKQLKAKFCKIRDTNVKTCEDSLNCFANL